MRPAWNRTEGSKNKARTKTLGWKWEAHTPARKIDTLRAASYCPNEPNLFPHLQCPATHLFPTDSFTYPQNSHLLLGPGADELLALGGDDADVGVFGGAVAHAPGAEAAGEGEDADDGVGPDFAGPDLEVVGTADAVDLEVVDGGGERAAGGLDGGPIYCKRRKNIDGLEHGTWRAV